MTPVAKAIKSHYRVAVWSRLCLLTFTLTASAASAQWNEQVLYSFQGGTDGAEPLGGMVFDKAGNLYGSTEQGGSSSCAGPLPCGTVFELSPPGKNGEPWIETILYVFRGRMYGDGASPTGGLITDAVGNLYGVTGYDGTGGCTLLGTVVGCGTVYELSPPSQPGGAWAETVLYSFQGGNDGYVPTGDLVFDNVGNLYGATLFGGGKGSNCNSLYGGNCGIIFELSPPKNKGSAWTEKVLHSFAGVESGAVMLGDGAEPNGGLVLDPDGNIYGTTQVGGFNCPHSSFLGCGTVFELAPEAGGAAWAETILHDFYVESSDGGGPLAGLELDEKGNLYGTTSGGGSSSEGTVFELTRPAASGAAWPEKVLYSFTFTNGALPSAPVLIDPRDGDLYVTAAGGGTSRGGTLSRLQTQSGTGWVDTVLYDFVVGSSNAAHPESKLVLHDGTLYSNSLWGGTGQVCNGGCGTVYKVWP